MSLEWEQVIVDAADPGALGRWWADALEWVVVNDDPEEFEIRPAPDRLPGLLFARVPETEDAQEPAAPRLPARRPGRRGGPPARPRRHPCRRRPGRAVLGRPQRSGRQRVLCAVVAVAPRGTGLSSALGVTRPGAAPIKRVRSGSMTDPFAVRKRRTSSNTATTAGTGARTRREGKTRRLLATPGSSARSRSPDTQPTPNQWRAVHCGACRASIGTSSSTGPVSLPEASGTSPLPAAGECWRSLRRSRRWSLSPHCRSRRWSAWSHRSSRTAARWVGAMVLVPAVVALGYLTAPGPRGTTMYRPAGAGAGGYRWRRRS